MLSQPRGGLVRVMVLDAGLAGPAGRLGQGSYVALLGRALRRSYPQLDFRVGRPAIQAGPEALPVERFIQVHRHLRETEANMVTLTVEPEAVVNAVPLASFETYLVATVDQVLSQTRAEPVLVTPPPLVGRPELSRAYARLVKKTGLRKGVLVVDLYSRFRLTENWQELFQSDLRQQPSYTLCPNAEGQRLISREILASIVARFNDELSLAARRAAYAAAEPGGAGSGSAAEDGGAEAR
jgi:hypothetical protein